MAEKMTKENYEKMAKKLNELKARRAVISKTIGEAREHGDLRENSAYHAAKEEQGLNEMRIRELEAKLESAIVVSAKEMGSNNEVRLGSTVKIVALDTEEEAEYTVVHESDADIFENKISTDSPIGGALFGRQKDDIVEVEIPRGEVKFKILEIK
jgi:transcription elongation factor GreA